MQRRIGLTGGIASGKSSVGKLLEARGWPVLDADHFARELLGPGTETTEAVLLRHPGVRREENRINREALGQIVFADASEREWLNGLIHPQVRRCFEQSLSEYANHSTIVLMIPLLFEARFTDLCSEIWLVDCDEKQQLERLVLRNALSKETAQARISAQWPMNRKRKLADVLIDNRRTKRDLRDQLLSL
jgi:dephospho-CoA kinase